MAVRATLPRSLAVVLLLPAGLIAACLWLISGVSAPGPGVPKPVLAQAPGVLYVVLDCTDAPAPCFPSIQAAVDAAASGDEIRIAQGAYTDTSSRAGVSQVAYVSKTLTLRGGYSPDFAVRDPAGMPTVADAQKKGRAIYATGEISLTLDGLSITGGDATGMEGSPWAGSAGGGVYAISATVTISNVRVFSNTAHWGGGVYLLRGDAVLESNTIFGNEAQGFGGGVHIEQYGVSRLQNNVVFSNTASTGGGGVSISSEQAVLVGNDIHDNLASQYGGGIFLHGSDGATVSNNLILDNDGYVYGGGIAVWFSDRVLVTGNTIQGNSSGSGGGIHARDSSGVTMTGNEIQRNRGSWGGGIHVFYAYHAVLSHNQIEGNSASHDGGGIFLWDAHMATIEGNEIAGNTAQGDGGGIHQFQSDDAMLVANRIISNVADCGGGMSILGDWHEQRAALNRMTIVDNTAQTNGGGLYARTCAHTTVDNAVISDNWAGAAGSGVYVSGCSPRFRHTSLARNSGGEGSGVHVTNEPDQHSHMTLTNTVLVSHTVGITVAAGNTATLQATLWGSEIWANRVDWDGAGTIITGAPDDNHWGDPAFVDPDAGDYHIGPGSAVDAGIETGVSRDIDAQIRPHYDRCDLGADEWWPLLTTKAAAPYIVEPGSVVTFTLALTNATSGAIDVHITDTMPVQVSYLGPLVCSSGNGGYASGVVTWTGVVYTDTPASITWTVRITPGVPYSTTIANSAVVSDAFGIFPTEPSLILVPPRYAYLPVVRQSR